MTTMAIKIKQMQQYNPHPPIPPNPGMMCEETNGQYVLASDALARENALLDVIKGYRAIGEPERARDHRDCDVVPCAFCKRADVLIREIEATRK